MGVEALPKSTLEISHSFSYHADLTSCERDLVLGCIDHMGRMRAVMNPDRFRFTHLGVPMRLHDQLWHGDVHALDYVYTIRARDYEEKTRTLGRQRLDIDFDPEGNWVNVQQQSLSAVDVRNQLRYRDNSPADLVDIFSTLLERVRTQHYRGLLEERTDAQEKDAHLARSESLSLCKGLIAASPWPEVSPPNLARFHDPGEASPERIARGRRFSLDKLDIVETQRGKVFDPPRRVLQRVMLRREPKVIEWGEVGLVASIGEMVLKAADEGGLSYASIENHEQIARAEDYTDATELNPEVDFLSALKEIVG